MISSEEFRVRLLLNGYRRLLRPMLFKSNNGDPEVIHEQMIRLLGDLPDTVLDLASKLIGQKSNPVRVAGIDFPGRVGVAAGLDKDARAVKAWGRLGFGFAELGTITARPQPGNNKPRLFRLVSSEGIINRMGFNNQGAEALARRLSGAGIRRGNNIMGLPLGISIGKNKVTPLDSATDDYLFALSTLADYADYVAINISSPNTPGLRNLQDEKALGALIEALVDRAKDLVPAGPLPLFVKLAPDLSENQLAAIVDICEEAGASGIIAANTTVGRENLARNDVWLANQAGGLSGKPLTRISIEMVEKITSRTQLPVMGVGGIMTPGDAQAMFDAGAKLVQVYTGFIFNGPALVTGINTLTQP